MSSTGYGVLEIERCARIQRPADMKLRQRVWADEFAKAAAVLGSPPIWSDKDYECFRWQNAAGTVRLIFYPHRTSAWNYHVRVREQGSRDQAAARELLARLDNSSRDCTFTGVTRYDWHRRMAGKG